jgi:small-conductance mechanosensitive channel
MLVQQLDPLFNLVRDTFSGESGRMLVTLVVVALAATGLRAAQRYLGQQVDDAPGSRDKARRRYVWARNAIGAVCILAICTIWASKLSGVALSLAAVAGAILIVSKEFLLCGLGYVFITFSRSFAVGDYIETGSLSGQVLDVDLFATTLMETGSMHQFNGKRVSIPNAVFFTQAVRNCSATGQYVLDTVKLAIPFEFDLREVEALAIAAARSVCESWHGEAREHIHRVENADLIFLPGAEPIAIFEPLDNKQNYLTLRFACPARRRMTAKQEILKTFWSSMRAAGLIAAPGPAASGAAASQAA